MTAKTEADFLREDKQHLKMALNARDSTIESLRAQLSVMSDENAALRAAILEGMAEKAGLVLAEALKKARWAGMRAAADLVVREKTPMQGRQAIMAAIEKEKAE